MAFGFTGYQDPGVFQQEVLVPSGINVPAQPFAVCLVGTGSRNKRVSNERVIRGIVSAEALSPAGSSPHTATLVNRADRKLESTTLYRTLNGVTTEILDTYISYNSAFILGTVTGTVDVSTNNAIGLELDGIAPITIVFHDTPAAITTNVVFAVSGTTVTLTRAAGSFITDGVRPGATLTVATAEDAGNDGTFTVLTVTATQVTYTNATGVANADDDTASITTSGTGRVGREVHVIFNFANPAAATITELVAATNQALLASTALGYGTSYGSVASVSAGAFRIASPLSSSSSDVRVSTPIATSAVNAIFGVAGASNRDAQSIVTISDTVWNASATWSLDYVALVDNADPLSITSDVQRLVSVGSFAGGSNFIPATDYLLTSNEVDWTPDAAAVVTGIAGAGGAPGTYDVNPADQLVIGFDGKVGTISNSVDLVIDLNGLVPAPLGYANPASADAATAAELVANINAVVAAELGPRYAAVASVASVNSFNVVRLTSPTEGRAGSSVSIVAAASNSAHTLLFGAGLLGQTLGTGARPAVGSAYFVTFEYTRPASDYDVPYRHFSVESAHAQVGAPSAETAAYNPLAIASEIAFRNGAQFIYTVQVDDQSEGAPTRNEVLSGLDGAGTISGATEIIVVGTPGTRLDITTDVLDHLEVQNSPTEKHRRRGFFGMVNNTTIGDKTQDNTWLQRAGRTLQPSASSPARGRCFLVVPPRPEGVTRDVTLEDGVVARLSLDSTYLAVATAARRTSLSGPAETLTKKTITGFNTDDITNVWSPAERRLLAGGGCCVVSYEAGRFVFRDARTTEGGGGNKESFLIDSTSYQKDVIEQKVDQALDANVVGIVPFDLATFILEIKLIIQGVLASEVGRAIGYYRDEDTGAIRPISLANDIRVAQDPNSQTTFNFSYWYNLRYPALLLLGQYSVDQPFFGLIAA